MYLIPSDFEVQIRAEVKTAMQGGSTSRFEIAEKAAIDQMRSYLKRRYDLDAVFPVLELYADGADYVAGDLVYWKAAGTGDDEYKVYEAIDDTTGNEPNAGAFWEVYRERNFFMVMYLVDLTLYHLTSRYSNGFAVRQKRYDEVLDWLNLVAKGEIDANLPQKETADTEPNPHVRWGSHPKEDHRW